MTIVVDMSVHAHHFKANSKDVFRVPSSIKTHLVEMKWEVNKENSIFTLQTERIIFRTFARGRTLRCRSECNLGAVLSPDRNCNIKHAQ